MRVSTLLWIVAYAALELGAFILPASASGVTGLALCGHLLWLTAGAVELSRGRNRRRPRARLLVIGILATFAVCEALGMAVALGEGEHDQALWFGIALGFALAGIASTCWSDPGDGVLVSQLFFHVLMIVPLSSAMINVAVSLWGGRSAAAAMGGAGAAARWMIIVTGVAFPALAVTLLGTLAYDLTRPSEERDRLWPALVAHQAAYLVLALRWSGNGL